MFLEILKGACIGALSVIVSWSKKQEPGKFDYRHLVLRLPTGIVIGIIAGYNGWDLIKAENFAASYGIILLVDHLTKLVIRKYEWFKAKKEVKQEDKKKIV